jgi:hypothetical protein
MDPWTGVDVRKAGEGAGKERIEEEEGEEEQGEGRKEQEGGTRRRSGSAW